MRLGSVGLGILVLVASAARANYLVDMAERNFFERLSPHSGPLQRLTAAEHREILRSVIALEHQRESGGRWFFPGKVGDPWNEIQYEHGIYRIDSIDESSMATVRRLRAGWEILAYRRSSNGLKEDPKGYSKDFGVKQRFADYAQKYSLIADSGGIGGEGVRLCSFNGQLPGRPEARTERQLNIVLSEEDGSLVAFYMNFKLGVVTEQDAPVNKELLALAKTYVKKKGYDDSGIRQICLLTGDGPPRYKYVGDHDVLEMTVNVKTKKPEITRMWVSAPPTRVKSTGPSSYELMVAEMRSAEAASRNGLIYFVGGLALLITVGVLIDVWRENWIASHKGRR